MLQVELPSQFMENCLYDKTTMKMISGHYKTGQTPPEEIFQQIYNGNKRVKLPQTSNFYTVVYHLKILVQELRKRTLFGLCRAGAGAKGFTSDRCGSCRY